MLRLTFSDIFQVDGDIRISVRTRLFMDKSKGMKQLMHYVAHSTCRMKVNWRLLARPSAYASRAPGNNNHPKNIYQTKYEALSECWFNVEPPSATLDQH